MDTELKCTSCQKPLPPNAPKGLCPECLIKAGFDTAVAAEPGQPSRTPAFVPPAVAEVAKLFPQFEILELLGHGGMGAVYKARQPTLDRLVALKILPPQPSGDSGFADRFTREARALAKLSHPNIVAVHEFGQTGGLNYFVMEYVEGLNLRQLEQAGKLTPREALKIIPQICDALQFAHDEGIVHRDIKPENVMLDKKGRVKIADFGLARIMGREPENLRLTGTKDVMGTPHYMAPEQVEHPQEVDHRADIYSLGVVFYEMLTGELPLGRFQPPSRKVEVDVRLDEVVLHALEKEPERRYQQASEVKSDVETIVRTSGRATVPPPPPPISPSAAAPGMPLPPASSAKPVTPGSAKVTIPAVGLIVAGLLKLFSALTAAILLGHPHGGWLGNLLGPAASVFPFSDPLFGWSIGLFKAIPALLMIYGGVQMMQLRSYAWSIAAGILGIVCCSFVGLPMGIWALIVLTKPDVREAFANPPALQTLRPGNWGWVWPTAGVLTLLLVLGLLLLALVGSAKSLFSWRHSGSGSGTHSYAAPQDTTETNLPVSAAMIIETPNPGDRQDASATAGAGSVQRTVTAGSEADLSKSFTVGRDGKLVMDVDRGGIRVVGADQETVDVRVSRKVRRASGSDPDRILVEEKLVLKQKGNEISISAQEPPSLRGGPGWRWTRPELDVNYEISVPRKFDLRLKTAGGGIKVATVQGGVNVRTAGGRLDFDDVDGNVEGQTQGGGIRAAGCKGELVVKTAGGRITVETFAGPFVQGKTIRGSITADFAASPKADCVLSTIGGSVTARIPATAMVTLDAHTEGGAVKSDLPVQAEGAAKGSTLRGKINGGGPSLKLETTGGSIHLLKR
jgi:serine/threonine protein kinase